MKITQPFEQMDAPYALAIGKFDGMHRGHQAIFARLAAEAPACRRVAYVFYPDADEQLSPLDERLTLLEHAGVEQAVVITAGSDVWRIEPEAFIAALCATGMLRAVVVGQSFRFGRAAAGDTQLLAKLGERFGFAVHLVAPVKVEGSVVSSSVIRRALAAGDMACVTQCLGRPYWLGGTVVSGKKLGRTFAFPTANLLPPRDKLLPAGGVYATQVEIDARVYAAMTNIGSNPTVDG
ncbi:MAG: riboflavin kinase, partial [Eubacteriales bacterium]|nr:riboflavin kinase [Eubacteriales bacterium]